jgi:serine protease Do
LGTAGLVVAAWMFGLRPDPPPLPPLARAQRPPSLREFSNQMAAVVEKVSPSVVSIEAVTVVPGFRFPADPFDPHSEQELFTPERRIPSVGSGFVVSAEGHILTNHHVINGVREISVTLPNGEVARARSVGSDSASDLAVLQIDRKDLKPVRWGEASKMRVGEFVLAFGSPFRMQGSVSHGIISGKGRRDLGIADLEDFLQTDAAINPGNSGGPLCNLDGEVVGVSTAILSRSGGSQGIGLAIPAEVARSVLKDILENGRVDRAWLGLWARSVAEIDARRLRLPRVQGVLVLGGYRNGPAGKAGFHGNDIILEMNGLTVKDEAQFRRMLVGVAIGKTVEFLVWRKGRSLTLKATTESRALDPLGRPARGI